MITSKTHTLSPCLQCLVGHGDDEDGNPVQQCKKCTVCGEWINTWNADTPCDLEARRARIRAHNEKTRENLKKLGWYPEVFK